MVARTCVVAALAAIAGPGFGQPAAPTDPEPRFYICHLERTDERGRVSYTINVPADGSARFHRLRWQNRRTDEGANLTVGWDGVSPPVGRLEDRAGLTIAFHTPQRVRQPVRIEMRRTPGRRYPSAFAFAGSYRRMFVWYDRPVRYLESSGRWGDVNAWMAGQERVTLALVRQDGEVVAEDVLQASTLSHAIEAIDALRRDVEAMADDYRNRCDVPGEVVVTSAHQRRD